MKIWWTEEVQGIRELTRGTEKGEKKMNKKKCGLHKLSLSSSTLSGIVVVVRHIGLQPVMSTGRRENGWVVEYGRYRQEGNTWLKVRSATRTHGRKRKLSQWL